MDWLIAYVILALLGLAKFGWRWVCGQAREHEALNSPMRKRR